VTNSSRHSTLLSAQSSLRVRRASKRQAFPSPGLFVLWPFCPTAFLSTGLLVLDSVRGISIMMTVLRESSRLYAIISLITVAARLCKKSRCGPYGALFACYLTESNISTPSTVCMYMNLIIIDKFE